MKLFILVCAGIGAATFANYYKLYLLDQGYFPHQHAHYEHQAPDKVVTMESLIDKSLAKAAAHDVPKNALAMLRLYGTEKESNWALNTMEDR